MLNNLCTLYRQTTMFDLLVTIAVVFDVKQIILAHLLCCIMLVIAVIVDVCFLPDMLWFTRFLEVQLSAVP